ncbi:MAG TPA: aspartate aminotransferase family protein [Ktedonobacterales bacterium]
MTSIARERLARLMEREQAVFERDHPRSRALHAEARRSLLSGVPMNWMTRWPGAFPIVAARAEGARLEDVDGHVYIDFCLGDTGAMAGHAPAPTIAAIDRQARRGLTTMLPCEDAIWVADELSRRFGLPTWQFTISATDANRFAIRLCREITGRSKVLIFDHCYHGSVDESFATLDGEGAVKPSAGAIGPGADLATTTRVVQWNDAAALERELAYGDTACVLAEPAMTNVGIVLPEPGFHNTLRDLTRRHGALLIIDETHTLCAGPGGYTRAYHLDPDLLTIGKAIGGGVTCGAYGMSEAVALRVLARTKWDLADMGGVGGTLAANPLSLAAMRATLGEILTGQAFERMIALGAAYERGVNATIARHDLPWHTARIGCRVEYLFVREPPRNGAEAAASMDHDLDAYLHLYLLNHGILMTPFHMMALMSPATTEEDVERHTQAFAEAVSELCG